MPRLTNEELATLIDGANTAANTNFRKAKRAVAGKVDKVSGKELSTNDFSDSLKAKLEALPTNAELQDDYVQKDGAKVLSDENFSTAFKNKLNSLPSNTDLQNALNSKTTMSDVQAQGYQNAAQVQAAIAAASHLTKEIVQTLPAANEADATKIYMILAQDGASGDLYDEYTLVNGALEKIGSTRIDISTLQLKITSSSKLSADLIEDGTTNKTVSASEKQSWDNKADLADINEAINTVFGNISITDWDSITLND